MKKETFNELPIEIQVKNFNRMVKERSIRKVCEELKIGKTTIRNRFEKEGYIFSRDKNQYMKDEAIELIKGNKIENEQEKVEEKVIKSNIILTKEKTIQLEELIDMVDDLKSMVRIWKRESEGQVKILKIKKFKGQLCVKSIKVYEEVLESFNEFVEKHREFKQQDIINQALWEFLQRYQ
ncbi:MAG: hypothetical protein N4A62_10515 [Marinisporobacter sp.]|nr:hypothetical protein [Marinisporobacter sp.]